MKYSILGEEISPRDWTNIGQVRKFVDSDNQISLTVNSVSLTGRARQIVENWVYNTYGREINIPVDATDQTGQLQQFYLDIKNNLTFTDIDVTTNIQVRRSSNHFFESASNLTYEVLNNAGLLTGFTDVPYQIFATTTKLERIVLIVTSIMMLIQLVQAAFELAKLIADALDVVGTGVLTALAKAIAYAAYLVGLLAVLITQGIELKNMYAPPVRYLKSMSDYTLIKVACEYLGFEFQSSFIYNRRQIETLPVTEQQPGKSIFKLFEYQMPDTYFNKGYPRFGDTVRTPIDIINWWLEFYNLEIKVADGVVRIETPEFFAENTDVTLETMLPDQEKVQMSWRFNDDTKRTWRRKFLSWSNDPQDVHTQDLATYNVAEYQSRNISIPAGCQDLAIMNGYSEILAPFALLRRKDELFPLEKFIHDFFKLLDSVANVFGGNSNLASNFIDERIGINIISGQFYGVTKKIWNDGNGRQPEDYLRVKFNTDKIYDERHVQLEFKYTNCRWVEMRIPMQPETFQSLQSNNYADLDTGEIVKVIDCTYFEEVDHRYAEIVFQMEDNSGFNVETVKIA